jgi:hypothetical protein
VVRFGYVFRHVCGNLLGVLTTCWTFGCNHNKRVNFASWV